ncbi:hypothetical protein QJS10_CPB15g01839 [Acorus calamus]|uniref:Transmembrane protein n=1 Tax=Acorus calamus TaxID=4465 RepID=A0AAV9DAT6_ACOCL|nr:hypothetical protein QJS10_CPB15g01839 [Acorus calamus]
MGTTSIPFTLTIIFVLLMKSSSVYANQTHSSSPSSFTKTYVGGAASEMPLDTDQTVAVHVKMRRLVPPSGPSHKGHSAPNFGRRGLLNFVES